METILEQGEPICIEVYLGPSSQRILLEQWIITIRDKCVQVLFIYNANLNYIIILIVKIYADNLRPP